MSVSGQCDETFRGVREAFERNFRDLGEVGASVCASVNGETVLDLWGGVADPDTGTPWTENTVSVVFSCTKAATALCAHILIDRGQLDPNALVTDYWPGFGKNGKHTTTVQMMLNHESALPALKDPVREGGFRNWDYMISRMEDEAPWWEPGTRNGYHMVNFGWTVGELVRRVSGKSLGQFFDEEIGIPHGVGFWIGVPDGFNEPIAPIRPHIPAEGEALGEFTTKLLTDPTSLQHLSFLNVGGWNPNDPEDQKAQVGGGGGISNARGQVAMYTPLAIGGGNLVSADQLAKMQEVSVATSRDETLLVPTRFASGFMKSMDNRGLPGGANMSAIMGRAAFGHVGAGGSIGFADPECGLAFSYTMNQMGPGLLLNERGQSLIDATYEALGYRTNTPGVWVK